MFTAGLALAAGLFSLTQPEMPGGLILGPSAALAGAVAVDSARITKLTDAMQLGPLLAVVREEGLAYGAGLDHDILGDSGGVPWRAEVARIYDPAKSRNVVDAALLSALKDDPDTLAAMEDFYASPLGIKVAGLEVAARRAFLDQGTKEAAIVAWQDMQEQHDPRAAQLTDFVAALGLIDQNVQGTLNANLALYRGLVAGGGLKSPLSEDDQTTQVAGQEAQARAAAEAWLYPYLALAYHPLSDAELAGYLKFLTSPAGLKANALTFAAFDTLFTGISHDIGYAASQRLAGQNI
jgi:hypothetical protein